MMNRWVSRQAEEKMWPRGARVEVEPVGWTNPERKCHFGTRDFVIFPAFSNQPWLVVFLSNSLLCLFGALSRFFFRIFTVSACDALILKQCI